MPYISIKAFPKDDETKQKTAEAVFEVIRKTMGAEPDWVTVSVEDIDPDDWEEKVVKAEILPKMDNVLILDGKKRYGTEPQ